MTWSSSSTAGSQTICEGCGFFETGPEFVTILRRQRDNVADHADRASTQLYDDLVCVVDNELPTADISPRTKRCGATQDSSHASMLPPRPRKITGLYHCG
jgi:hypothetical protein